MKMRRVLLEVLVPEEFDGRFVANAVGVGFGESCEHIEQYDVIVLRERSDDVKEFTDAEWVRLKETGKPNLRCP